jgi:hypothetical protein
MTDPTRWLEGLAGLLSIPVGGRSGDDFELRSIESREITEAERARFGEDVLGFITFAPVNSKLRVAEITVAAGIPCPIQKFLVATHEQAHLLAEHSGWRGQVRLSAAQVEAEADLLAVAIRKRRTGKLLDVCEACAGNYPLECTSCPHPLLGDLLEGLGKLELGGQVLREELIRQARTPEGQRFFETAGKGATIGFPPRPLLELPKSKQSKLHPGYVEPANDDELDPASIGARVAAAVVAKVVAAFGPGAVAEGERIQDEGSGRFVRPIAGPRQMRFSEDEGEVLMQRFVDPLTDEPIEGELGQWHEAEEDAQ